MKSLARISITFLKKSRRLTVACFISVFVASFLLVLMYNLTINAQRSYEQNVRDTLGDCDIIANAPEESAVSQETIQKIKALSGVDSVESGRLGTLTIEHRSVNAAGVMNGTSNRARYQYSANITDEQIILNHVLAESLQVSEGDTLTVGSRKLSVIEIIFDDSYSIQNKYFAIVTQPVLCELLEVENEPNYLFIKRKKEEHLDSTADAVRQCSPDLEVVPVENVAQYKAQVLGFRIFMRILGFIVVCICALLIAEVFYSFLRKYYRDMMVLRTIGGRNRQVAVIFLLLASLIAGAACLSSLLAAVTVGKLLFTVFANKLSLSIEATDIHPAPSALLALAVFCILLLFLAYSVIRFVKALPLQSMRQNTGQHRVYTGKGLLSRIITGLLHGDRLVSYKMAVPKIRDNILLLLTILFLTLFSYVGNDAMNQIAITNADFYNSVYLDELMITNGDRLELSYKDAMFIYQELENNADCQIFPLIELDPSFLKEYEMSGNSFADFEKMRKQRLISVEADNYENAILIYKELAEKSGFREGEQYKMSDIKRAKYEYYDEEDSMQPTDTVLVAGILNGIWWGFPIYDIHHPGFQPKDDDPVLITLFGSEHTKQVDGLLQELRNTYPNLQWQSHSAMTEWCEKIISERFLMISAVLYVLTILAGAGWFNSAKNMITSQLRDYRILRQLGMSEKRVRRIIWRQIFLYLLLGIGLGIVLGILITSWFTYYETDGEISEFHFHINNITFLLVYYVALLAALIPHVKKSAGING